jgi:hypothetical protein
MGWLLAALLTPSPASAQAVHLAAFGAAATNTEVEDTRQARGLGFGLGARAELSRFRAEARYLHAALRADFSIQPDYNVDEIDLAVTWFWRSYLAAQIGAARRFISPDLVAQDVGLIRIGVLSETRLARIAGVWVRGAYLPLSRFSGGGSAGLGLEVGLGVEVGDPAARLQGFASFEYQRIDREATAKAPLQFSVGQLGVKFRLGALLSDRPASGTPPARR